jgi:hypothetical protein
MRSRRHLLLLAVSSASAGLSGTAFAQSEDPPSAVVRTLRQVTRLCVEDFDGGENARQLRALLIAEIHRLGAFVITENPKKADAFIRGFAEDLVFTERHSRDDNITGRSSGQVSTGGYTRNRASASRSEGGSASVRDRSETRRHEASLTVRIVNVDGDVLWGETAESRGGKFRSASAEVAEKIAVSLKASLAPAATEPDTRKTP